MLSGECTVAPSTPKPPARLTAATTSRQWLKASSGNSMPSISQIGDFMAVSTPCGSYLALLVLCLNFREFFNDASLSEACMPSGLRPHPEERRRRRASKDEGPTVASWFSPRCEASSGDGASAPPHHEGRVFHAAKYATRQGCFVSCAFAAAGRMLSATREKSREFECPPCNRFPAKATPQATRPTMSSWSAPVLPACTCCTGCAGWD